MSQGQGRRRPKLGHGSRSRIHHAKLRRKKHEKHEKREPKIRDEHDPRNQKDES
jgi:hypothetical protein